MDSCLDTLIRHLNAFDVIDARAPVLLGMLELTVHLMELNTTTVNLSHQMYLQNSHASSSIKSGQLVTLTGISNKFIIYAMETNECKTC